MKTPSQQINYETHVQCNRIRVHAGSLPTDKQIQIRYFFFLIITSLVSTVNHLTQRTSSSLCATKSQVHPKTETSKFIKALKEITKA